MSGAERETAVLPSNMLLSVEWYPGMGHRDGSWHVIGNGWRHISSHQTEGDAIKALRLLKSSTLANTQEGRDL